MLPDIGLGELLVVVFVVLLVGRPEDVPVVMRKLGVWSAHLQHFVRGIWAGWQEQTGLQEMTVLEDEDLPKLKTANRKVKRKPKA